MNDENKRPSTVPKSDHGRQDSRRPSPADAGSAATYLSERCSAGEGGPAPEGTALHKRPLYVQVHDALAERIAKNVWKAGTAMPNEGDLAREFGVSTGTMRKALDLLESEHLVARVQGRGTFVNDPTTSDFASRFTNLRTSDGERLAREVTTAEISVGVASEKEREQLRLRAGDTVCRIRRIGCIGSQPVTVERASLPAVLFPDLAKTSPLPENIAQLAFRFGILLGKAEERILIDAASAEVAEALQVAPGSPTLLLDRVVRSCNGQPVEWRMVWCNLGENYYLSRMD
jgi:GntR family transcriptional regulator